MAQTLGNHVIGLTQTIKEALIGNGGPLSTADTPNTDFIPMATPFVTVNGDTTASIFVYGISEYGGEDVVIGPEGPRYEKRFFLTIE